MVFWLPHTVLVLSGLSVSLQQMVLFGQNPSQGTLFKASQFLSGNCTRLRAENILLMTTPRQRNCPYDLRIA
jgi:hypothetical protein